ncbi:MAG: twin-arginine translocase TatA/TatE family subunit [Acidobacteriota bacterium]|nr:twin-arginine translocase TatA/TatE family subunit [Acidobacteriota bacterium]
MLILLFGARKIPDLARGLGEGIRGFRSSLRGGDDDNGGQSDKGANGS